MLDSLRILDGSAVSVIYVSLKSKCYFLVFSVWCPFIDKTKNTNITTGQNIKVSKSGNAKVND